MSEIAPLHHNQPPSDAEQADFKKLTDAYMPKGDMPTLRDLMAGFALCGLISYKDEPSSERAIHNTLNQRNISIFELFSESAYKYADAMLKERIK